MAFQVRDEHIEQYYREGYTIFEDIVPAAMIRDLRKATEKAREIAPTVQGARKIFHVQQQLGELLDLQIFRDYKQLPDLIDAFRKVLTPKHQLAPMEAYLEIFFEPKEHPHLLKWHRDLWPTSPGIDPEEFKRLDQDPTFFAKANCPLYVDGAFWYVPGSVARPDFPYEHEIRDAVPPLDSLYDPVERERACFDYIRKMPNARQVLAGPGDIMLYRSNGWHTGVYFPHIKRSTLLDVLVTPESLQWFGKWRAKAQAERRTNTENY